jgi:hypothetical protein
VVGREKLTHQAINYMLSVGVVRRVYTLPPNEIHDFVLSFAGNTSIRNNDLQLQDNVISTFVSNHRYTYVLPAGIRVLFLYNPVPQRLR